MAVRAKLQQKRSAVKKIQKIIAKFAAMKENEE